MTTCPEALAAERDIARRFGREHALLTGRATTALYLLLKALGFERAEILIPVNACYAVPLAVLRSGNVPVFCDISLDHFGVTVETLARARTPRTRAAVVLHMYGHTGDWNSLADWCRHEALYLIEDAALALGGAVQGRKTGALGDSSLLSFGAGKIIDCGGGGALLTGDGAIRREAKRVAESLPAFHADLSARMAEFGQIYRLLRQFERRHAGIHKGYGALFDLYAESYFFRPDPVWADRIRQELPTLDLRFERRRRRAEFYASQLRRPWLVHTHFPDESMVWRYTLRCWHKRDELIECLRHHGIPVSSWYPAVDRMFAARESGLPSPYPQADFASDQVVNLWVDETLSDDAVRRTVDLIDQWLAAQDFGLNPENSPLAVSH